MELLLERTEKTQTYTAGSLYVVNELGKAYFCNTLEPSLHPTNHLRPKAIPAGRYDVAVTWSPRFTAAYSWDAHCSPDTSITAAAHWNA